MTNTSDVIIIGGGMLGLSTAYHLAQKGAHTLLLQADEIGAGSSAACAGRAQVAEGKLDPFNLSVIKDGFSHLDTLEDELGMSFEFRRSGFLALINSQRHWDEWVERSRILTENDIPTEMLDKASLREAEPYLNTDSYLGAAYAIEGWLNPFLFCWAYSKAAQRNGAILKANTPVTKMHLDGGKVVSVEAGGNRYSADSIVVMCGAWTASVLQLAGSDLPVHFTHAQAFITDTAPIALNNTIALANFYDLIHGKDQAVAVGFNQDSHGALIVTEAVQKVSQPHTGTSAWGIAGIATELLKLYPDLGNLPILRTWGIPTPFTPDDEPIIGWVPKRENLFVAAGFMQTITSVPVVSPWMAQMILGDTLPVDLSAYAPTRFHIN